MAIPVIRQSMAKARAASAMSPTVSATPGLGPILDQLLPTPSKKKPWWPANQNKPFWDTPNFIRPGDKRPPWANKPFGRKPYPTIGGLPFKAPPWLGPAATIGVGLGIQYLWQPSALPLRQMGWTLCCDVGLPILDGITIQSHSQSIPCTEAAASLCGLSGQVTGSNWDVAAYTASQRRTLFLGMKSVARTRQTHGQIWSKGSTATKSGNIKPRPMPIPVDPLMEPGLPLTPQIDPPWMPDIDVPVPRPRPIPRVSPRPGPINPPIARPRNYPGEPAYTPTVQIDPSAQPGARPVPVKPPKDGRTKERKLILAINKRTFIGVVLNAVGETADFIECFYDALPKSVRREFERKYGIYGKVSASQKLFGLWQHFGKLDWNAVVHNLVVNELEDRFFGKIGKLGAVANRIKDNYMGYGTGGFQIGYAM